MENKELAIFELVLGDITPWKIVSYSFGSESELVPELHIKLDFERCSTFTDRYGQACKLHDTTWHTWRHMDFFQYRCYITARVPRILNSQGVVETVQAPWALKNNGFTTLFEHHVMSLIQKEMPVSGVANQVGEYDQRIWNIFRRHVDKAIAGTDFGLVRRIGIDETSKKKGYNYITVAVDLDAKRIVFVTDGKKAEGVEKVAVELEKRGSSRDLVDLVSIDMSAAFIAGATQSFPNANIVFDKFHVVMKVNDGLDKVRRIEKEEAELIKGMRYSLLRNPENLSDKKIETLWDKIILMPTIGEAYRLKEMLKDFWDFKDPILAECYLRDWCKEVDDSGIIPMIKAANTIRSHWSGVLNYIKTRITNAILEGINSKIQLAKRRARGYRNDDNFKRMVMFFGGKLTMPDYGLPQTQIHWNS
jgi:transposase